MKGYPRDLATKDDYDNQEFRSHCRELASGIKESMEKFERVGFEVYGVVGVAASPSCGVYETHREEVEERVKESGVFMEELEKAVDKPFVDFDYKRPNISLKKLETILRYGFEDEGHK